MEEEVSVASGGGATSRASLPCPLCPMGFLTGQDLELHVNVTHSDILSPAAAAGVRPRWDRVSEQCL